MRHSNKLQDLAWPSRYQLWYTLTKGSELATKIGPERLCQILNEEGLIELVTVKNKENVKCKPLNLTKQALEPIYQRILEEPYFSLQYSYFQLVVKRILNKATVARPAKTK